MSEEALQIAEKRVVKGKGKIYSSKWRVPKNREIRKHFSVISAKK